MSRLENNLILNRWCLDQLGFGSFEELKDIFISDTWSIGQN